MNPEIENAPDGLSVIQYATFICANMLAWPENPSNLHLVADSISAVAKKWRSTPRKAFIWMAKKLELAEQQGMVIDGFFFREGRYNTIHAEEKVSGSFKPMDAIEKAAIDAGMNKKFGSYEDFKLSAEYREFIAKMGAKSL